jgi:hypothetical protein
MGPNAEIDYGTHQPRKNDRRNPADLAGPALVENSLCPGHEQHTMRETEVPNRNLVLAHHYTKNPNQSQL